MAGTPYSTASEVVTGYYDTNGAFIQFGSGGTGDNASVGANGSTIPGSSTLIGIENPAGNLEPVGGANPVPVIFAVASPTNSGTISGNASATNTSSTQIIAGVTGKKVYVQGWTLSNTGATTVTVQFQDGSGGSSIGAPIIVPAGGGNNMPSSASWCNTSSNNGLYFVASGSTTTLYVGVIGSQQ